MRFQRTLTKSLAIYNLTVVSYDDDGTGNLLLVDCIGNDGIE